MNATQKEKRIDLFRSIRALLEYWKGEKGAVFCREMEAAVKELEALVRDADATSDDRRECARNWRFLGDAYYDLSNGRDPARLRKSLEAYRKAKALLAEIDDPDEKMKLSFRCGASLFGLSNGRDTALLLEARSEYIQALDIARFLSAETAETVKKALSAVNQLMMLMEERGDLWRHIASRRESEARSASEYDLDIGIPEDAALFSRLLDVHYRMLAASQKPQVS